MDHQGQRSIRDAAVQQRGLVQGHQDGRGVGRLQPGPGVKGIAGLVQPVLGQG